jgi:tetratricopeptide (TPR) repeat protein
MATGDVEAVADLLAAIWRFWQSRGHVQEGRARADQVLAMPGFEAAPLPTRIAVREVAGGLGYWAGDIVSTHTHYREQVRLARQLGDPSTLANALYNAGFAPIPALDNEEWAASIRDLAEPLITEAIAIWEREGDEAGIARGTWMLGELKLFQQANEEADEHYTLALDRFARLGDDFGAAWAYFTRGVARAERRPDEAIADLREALERFRAAGELPGVAFIALAAAPILERAGDHVGAQRLLGVGVHFREDSGAQLAALSPPGFSLGVDPVPADDPLRPAYEEGYALPRDAAIELLRGILAAWPRSG